MSSWTLAVKGQKQIPIIGLDDKREVTAILAASASGDLLPPQILYKGTTEKCHPPVDFPKDWDIWHSTNHWSNESTMLRYIDQIIIPHMNKQRQILDLPAAQQGLCIFDTFSAHQCESVTTKLHDNNILYVNVPPGCTGDLQPMDLTVNELYKRELKNKFHTWYANQIEDQLKKGVSICETKVDFPLSVMKPIHASWVVDVHQAMANRRSVIVAGFMKAGIILADKDSDADTLPYVSDEEGSIVKTEKL